MRPMLLLLLLLASTTDGQFLDQDDARAPGRPGQLTQQLADRLVRVYPGLMDESLTQRGSFAFGAQTVKIEKLKVLGNVYVRKVNGRPLRETYLLRSQLARRPLGGHSQPADGNKGFQARALA